MLDTFYISFFNYLKPKFKRKAIGFSLVYISFLEIALYSVIFLFFIAFASQMNLLKIGTSKTITIGLIGIAFIYFKNWMQYNGKRRNVLNAKSKQRIQKWKLIIVPLAFIILSVILYQAI